MAKTIQCANLRECFKDTLIRKAKVDAFKELLQRSWRISQTACCNDRLRCASTDILHAEQTEANRISLRLKVEHRVIDVWRQDGNAESAALRDCGRHLLLFAAECVEDTRHVVNGVVRLQVGRLVGDQAVAGRMRLVESVVGERLKRLEYLFDDARLNASRRC